MQVTGLFHVAIKTARPEATKNFYEQVLGMSEAPRPNFEFPGFWMQVDTPQGGALFHIYTGDAAKSSDGTVAVGTAAIDHVSVSAVGFDEMRKRCRKLNVPFRERVVPGFPLWQLFVYDPNGVQFELQFHKAAEERPGVGVDPDNFVKAGEEWFDPAAYEQYETA